MPSADILVQYWPGWLSLAVAVILVTNKLVEESYKFASLFGRWGRELHKRALTRHHVNLAAEQFATAMRKAVEEAREEWENEDNAAIAALNSRLRTVSGVTADQDKHIKELLGESRTTKAYLAYEGLWHDKFRAVGGRASDGLLHLTDLPVHINFYDFEAALRENPKWQEWCGL